MLLLFLFFFVGFGVSHELTAVMFFLSFFLSFLNLAIFDTSVCFSLKTSILFSIFFRLYHDFNYSN